MTFDRITVEPEKLEGKQSLARPSKGISGSLPCSSLSVRTVPVGSGNE